MNKRKIILLATALCMVAILAAGGTLAYFMDTDEATNVFVIGHVSIKQEEWQRELDENGDPVANSTKIEAFDDNKNVFPAVLEKLVKEDITHGDYTFKIRSLKGNYIDKIVDVTNTGTEEAYIRTIFAIPSMNGYDDSADATENPLHWNYLDATDFEGGWDWNGSNDEEATVQKEYAQDVVINGVKYDLYVATHKAAVPAGETTSPSMVGFYLDDDVNYDEKGYFSMQNGKRIDLAQWMTPDTDTGKVTMEILVATEACQTEGFADAWEALDECFGAITAENNPWTTWNK